MNIDFSLELLVSTEDMHGDIPIAVEMSIDAHCQYTLEAEIRYPNEEAYPGYENTEVTRINGVFADVEWYTPAPDGSMTVYHVLHLYLKGETAWDWLEIWGVDVQDAVDKEGIVLDDIMDQE